MTQAAAVTVANWHSYLRDLIETEREEGSLRRQTIDMFFRLDEDGQRYRLGTSRDSFGSVVYLHPDIPDAFAEHQREWRQAWAKVAVRAGYRAPGIDPEAYRELCRLANSPSTRIEFIFDTTELISGGGHWLVRMFGSRADLVRTAITDKEVHGFRDIWRTQRILPADSTSKELGKGKPKTKEAFKRFTCRMNFLAATRFLERLPDPQPIWRSLDVEDSALLLASAGSDGEKSPAADTLVLRAARRAIQDQVPRMRRFFVTGDAASARKATHMLPHGSVIATWVAPLADQGEHLAPVQWWPAASPSDNGNARITFLSDLVLEALCLASEVELQTSTTIFRVRAYHPGRNEFPSFWHRPVVWISQFPVCETSISDEKALPKTTGTVRVDQRVPSTPPDAIEPPPNKSTSDWPLRAIQPLFPPAITGARLPPGRIFASVEQIASSVRRGDATVAPFSPTLDRESELVGFLQATRLLNDDYSLGEAAGQLPDVLSDADTDQLCCILLGAEPLQDLWRELVSARTHDLTSPDRFAGLTGRKKSAYVLLLRTLGLAVRDGDTLYDGSGSPEESTLGAWLLQRVDVLSKEDPLNEVPVSRLVREALIEHQLSPARFARALEHLLSHSMAHDLEGVRGGTPSSNDLEENVAQIEDGQILVRPVSADGLCGLRTLKRKHVS